MGISVAKERVAGLGLEGARRFETLLRLKAAGQGEKNRETGRPDSHAPSLRRISRESAGLGRPMETP